MGNKIILSLYLSAWAVLLCGCATMNDLAEGGRGVRLLSEVECKRIANGKSPNREYDLSKCLYFAVRDRKIVESAFLIASGAKVDFQGDEGKTPLMIASTDGGSSIVRLLLQYCADKELQDDDENTAWELAQENGHAEIVELLETYQQRAECLNQNI